MTFPCRVSRGSAAHPTSTLLPVMGGGRANRSNRGINYSSFRSRVHVYRKWNPFSTVLLLEVFSRLATLPSLSLSEQRQLLGQPFRICLNFSKWWRWADFPELRARWIRRDYALGSSDNLAEVSKSGIMTIFVDPPRVLSKLFSLSLSVLLSFSRRKLMIVLD